MSPQDKVERVLKEIHILFSKSESYQGKPDKVVVDRRKFLELLDRLNKGIFDMMDTYEHTRESRAKAELAFENKGKEMIADAEEKADDVYAASVIYTANMLGEVQRLIDQANESINDVFVQFKRELRSQKETVKSNELELTAQLNDLADSKTYQDMVANVRREQRKKHRMEDLKKLKQEEEAPAFIQQAGQIYVPATNPEGVQTEKPEVKVNMNSEYFRRKAMEARRAALEEAIANGEDLPEGFDLDAELDDEILRELARLEDQVEHEPTGKRGPTITLERKTKSQQKEIFKEVQKKEKKWLEESHDPVPSWKSRLQTLVNEILPKDIHDR